MSKYYENTIEGINLTLMRTYLQHKNFLKYGSKFSLADFCRDFWVEVDLRPCRDGIVVFHDPCLKSDNTGTQAPLTTLTCAQIQRRVRRRYNISVPTLAEMLDYYASLELPINFNLELKWEPEYDNDNEVDTHHLATLSLVPDRVAKELMNRIRAGQYSSKQFVISSFHHPYLRSFRNNKLFNDKDNKYEAQIKFKRGYLYESEDFAKIDKIVKNRLYIVDYNYLFRNNSDKPYQERLRELYQKLREHNCKLWLYTVDPDTLMELWEIRIDGIITDFAEK